MLPVFRSRANLVGRQIRISIVIGCGLPDTEEIAHAGSAFYHWITGSWRLLDGQFEPFLSGDWGLTEVVKSGLCECETSSSVLMMIEVVRQCYVMI